MSEPKPAETLEQVFKRSADADTAAQIVTQLNRSATEGFHSAETAAAASAIHAELVKRLDTVTDPEAQIAIARAARDHFQQVFKANTERYVIQCVENEWKPRQAKLFYKQHPEKRPSDSKYSLEEIKAFRDEASAPKPIAPEETQ